MLDFLRDKFTADGSLSVSAKGNLGAPPQDVRVWRIARRTEAQRAFNFERGHTTRRFIPDETWDDLHEGLMAGERLDFALRHMEKAYLDENVREYELTKHFSLRLHFPMEFLRIKETGRCEIELPEWMFDLDYPGQYMRRIKNVTLTIPCVTGPYNGVHCRATLLEQRDAHRSAVGSSIHRLLLRMRTARAYEACPHDPRVVRIYGAREAIATSSGQNDSGMFELNFHDERYLPFEFQGAVCRWRIELPPENNYFPMESLTDVLLHLNHTAREGGEMLRRTSSRSAQRHLPGSGWCFFDVRHEFPDAWQLLHDSCGDKDASAKLALCLERKMFPYIPSAGELSIAGMAIMFHAEAECGCDDWKSEDCPCPDEGEPSRHVVRFKSRRHHDEDEQCISCLASEDATGLYYGAFDTQVGPLGGDNPRAEVQFLFPPNIGELDRVFLLCRYERRHHAC